MVFMMINLMMALENIKYCWKRTCPRPQEPFWASLLTSNLKSNLSVDRFFATHSFSPTGFSIQPVLSLCSGFCITHELVVLVTGAPSLEPVDFSAPSKNFDRNLRPYIRLCVKHVT